MFHESSTDQNKYISPLPEISLMYKIKRSVLAYGSDESPCKQLALCSCQNFHCTALP